jgi:hypothetical protein
LLEDDNFDNDKEAEDGFVVIAGSGHVVVPEND